MNFISCRMAGYPGMSTCAQTHCSPCLQKLIENTCNNHVLVNVLCIGFSGFPLEHCVATMTPGLHLSNIVTRHPCSWIIQELQARILHALHNASLLAVNVGSARDKTADPLHPQLM
jgi:hypothetical protein